MSLPEKEFVVKFSPEEISFLLTALFIEKANVRKMIHGDDLVQNKDISEYVEMNDRLIKKLQTLTV